MNIIWRVVIAAVLLAGILFYGLDKYVWAYQIANNEMAVKKALNQNANENDSTLSVKDVKKVTQIGHSSSYVALFVTNGNQFGYARLIKGWNDQFKIGYPIGYGTQPFQQEIFKTNKGKYVMVTGIDENHQIDHIKIHILKTEFRTIYQTTYKIKSQKDFYVKFSKIPDHIDKHTVVDVQLFNSKNERITNDVLKNDGL